MPVALRLEKGKNRKQNTQHIGQQLEMNKENK